MGSCSSKKRSVAVSADGAKSTQGKKLAPSDSVQLPPKSKSDPDLVEDFEEISFISNDGYVVVMTRVGNHLWQCTRLDRSATHIKILLFYGPDHPEYTRKGRHSKPFLGWVLCDVNSGEPDPVCVEPAVGAEQMAKRPPVGECWERVWLTGMRTPGWSLAFAVPELEPMAPTHAYKSESCSVDFKCDGNLAQAWIKMHKDPLTDESLEGLLAEFKLFLIELAKRPDMTLFWVLDLQGAPVMRQKHVNRFLAWVDEQSLPLRLLVRGSVIKLDANNWLGWAVQKVVQFVLSLKPPPWPSQVVPTQQEAVSYINQYMQRARDLSSEAKKKEVRDLSSVKDKSRQSFLSGHLSEDADDKPVQIFELERGGEHPRCQPCVCSVWGG